jgi:Family of unknown function (DUF6350)
MSILLPSKAANRTRSADPRAPDAPPRPLLVAGLNGAAHAAALGLLTVTVIVLVGWATAADSGASAGEAVRSAVQVWLVGHGGALAVPGGRFSLTPLGLTALPALLLYLAAARAARSAAVTTLRAAVSLTAVLAGSYAVLSALLALVARTDDVRPLPVSAFLAAAALALAAGGAGALRASGSWPELRRRAPAPLELAVSGGLAGLAVLLTGGALLAATSLAAHHNAAVAITRGLDAGALGGLLLFCAGLLYVPTAVVWAASFAAGPGFALGVGTSATPWDTHLAAAPAFPLLAALPGGVGSGSYLVLVVPVAAGVLAGLVAGRAAVGLRAAELRTWRRAGAIGLGAGAVAGLGFAILTWAAAGATGPGRLGHAGPPWWTGFAVAVEIGAVATATLVVRRHLRAVQDGAATE